MSYRKERIERLLEELKYEVVRGMMEGEIDEHMGFRFVVPVSKEMPNGIVACSFITKPAPSYEAGYYDAPPRLTVVNNKQERNSK